MNDFLLNLFTLNDKSRPVLMFPSLKDGIVYASDGHVLIAIPETELSLKYQTGYKYPNAQKLIDDFETSPTTSIKVKVKDIAKELAKARIIIDKKTIDCQECNGTGEVEWTYEAEDGKEYDMYNNCPVCDGEGRHDESVHFARVSLSLIENKETGFLSGIYIDDLYFHPFHLYRLFMVAIAKGYDEIEILFNQEKYGQTITYFDNIKVLVMLMLKPVQIKE